MIIATWNVNSVRSRLERVVGWTERARPDVLCLQEIKTTDDLFPRERFTELGYHAEVFGQKTYNGVALLALAPITKVERNGTRFWVAGTGDPAGRRGSPVAPDVERTLAAVPPEGFTLALAHNPALWPALAEHGVELTLSGHTHYGQIAIPRLGWSLASPFLEHAMGQHQKDGSQLYINPGTNYWGIPFRLGTPPEVTVLTLRRGPGAASHTHPPLKRNRPAWEPAGHAS